MNRPLSFLRRCVNALPLRFRGSRPAPSKRRSRVIPQIEILEDRLAPAITGQGTNFWIDQGAAYTGKLAAFSDTDTNASFTASANYGDGYTDNSPAIAPDPNGGFDVLANHSAMLRPEHFN